MKFSSPLRVAVTGMGGFAASHQRALLALEQSGLCRVIGACDPFPENFAAQQEEWQFAERGVCVFDDWQKMLDELKNQLDVLFVPAPVPLHAPIHKAAVERGIACYLEKPPTLFWRELEEMLEVEKNARFATNVGFNFIVETARQNLKKRILSGEFGKLHCVKFLGHWPRPRSYFTRSPWAGKIALEGRLVLDSCIGNAMAHYIHNLLFWAGTRQLFDWASVAQIEAELYRAHDIENYDTVLTRGKFDNGVQFRIAASHACKPPQFQWEEIRCEKATITYVVGRQWHIRWHRNARSLKPEAGEADGGDLLIRNFTAYFDYLHKKMPRPLTTLQESKPFVHLTNLVYVAAEKIRTAQTVKRDGDWVTIEGIEELSSRFLQRHYPASRRISNVYVNRVQARDVVKLEEVLQRINTYHD